MKALDEAQAKASATYNAAADFYDDPANTLLGSIRPTHRVERLDLTPGARVLDVCCGSGASALPAAHAVGSNGTVLGVDLAQRLLEIARRRDLRGLRNIDFRVGDLLDLGLPAAGFDAVLCVFGIFFRARHGRCRARNSGESCAPGGRLGDHDVGAAFLRAGEHRFLECGTGGGARASQGIATRGIGSAIRPRCASSSRMRGSERRGGGRGRRRPRSPRPRPGGRPCSGRATGARCEQLDARAGEHVRVRNLRFIRERGIRAVQANVVYAVAAKPS